MKGLLSGRNLNWSQRSHPTSFVALADQFNPTVVTARERA